MYKKIFIIVMSTIGLSGISFIDKFLSTIAAVLIHCLVYSIVGFLYKSDLIRGSFLGKFFYFVIWVTTFIGCIFLAIYCQNNKICLIIIASILLVFKLICSVRKFIN